MSWFFSFPVEFESTERGRVRNARPCWVWAWPPGSTPPPPPIHLTDGQMGWINLWVTPSASPARYVSFGPCCPAPTHQTPGELLATCSQGKMGKKGMGLWPCDNLDL